MSILFDFNRLSTFGTKREPPRGRLPVALRGACAFKIWTPHEFDDRSSIAVNPNEDRVVGVDFNGVAVAKPNGAAL